MVFSVIHKYGFPFNWFIDTYNEINEINRIGLTNNLTDDIKNEINEIYIGEHLNYSEFINKVGILLNISSNDKIKFLEKEIKCKLCEQNYPHSFEIFTEFIDWKTKQKINNTICFDCAYSTYTCSNCNFNFGNEPYEHIYIYPNEIFKNKFLTICETCYNIPIPLFSLFYKDIEINIQYNDITDITDITDID